MGHKKLEDMKKSGSYEEIGAIKKDLIKIFDSEIHRKGVDDLDTKDCGEVVDMIKDLAEAEKACMEACYYETIVKAMEKADEDGEEDEKMGYNARHYASGRFAPKGRGTRMGYMPETMRYPYFNDDDMIAALESGKVACYVTDFPNNKITLAKHVVAIPHLGASSPESEALTV